MDGQTTLLSTVLSGTSMQMPRHLVRLSAILAVVFATTNANAAEKSLYNCRNGNLVRRVVIEVGDLATGLPCEVVYWKDIETPGVRRVLWNARSDGNFCATKAAGLVDKLGNSGWACEQDGATVTSLALSLEAQTAEPTSEIARVSEAASVNAAVPTLDAATVAKAPPAPTGAGNDPLIPSLATETTLAPSPQQVPNTAPQTPSQTAAVTPTALSIGQLTEELQTVIAQNLSSLNKSVDGDFKAELGQFGDLNADGLDDAVVFFNYESSTADFTQFVAAYLFNGDSYHLAATKPVGGTERAVQKVEVENIVDGSILLKLHLNDASQTESRRAAMSLKDGQLVETE